MWFYLLIPFSIVFLLTIVLTPLTILLAKKHRLVDDPQIRKHPAALHKKPIPRAGGAPIFLAIACAMLLLLPMTPLNIAILIASGIAVVVGLLDDRYDISPYIRFFVNILCALIVVLAGVSVPFITNPFGGTLHFDHITLVSLFGFTVTLAHAIALVWIVWVMNMLNWSKGVDGQMPGIAGISAVIIGIAALRFVPLETINQQTGSLAFMVAGGAFGFLVYNVSPARIFPGYSATVLGFLIGVLSITSGVKLATAVLVMGVPTIDALFTIGRRLLARKSPFWHDRGHLHHLLLEYGLSARSIAAFYWAMSMVLGLVALSASSRGKLFAIILLLVIFSSLFFMLRIIVKKGQEYD